jgi:ribosomal protein S18 acetylase RimI-like enzyme
MAGEQLRRLGARELRPYRAEDEPAVLALWARALPRWPVGAAAFRSRAVGGEQLVMVAGGALAGYVSVARAETRAQLTAILVDPAYRRAGLGSVLLAQARRSLGGGVKSLSVGSGAGSYFWPGVPEDAPDGWAFLRAHGFAPTGEVVDLLAELARFQVPAWVISRAGDGVRFELAAKDDAAEVIALQERHFPVWKAAYEHQLTLPGTVLVARAGEQIVGTCTVEGPAEHDFLWRALVPGPVGAFGCGRGSCGASAGDRSSDGRPCLRTAVGARRGGLLLRVYLHGGLVRPARIHPLARLHHGQRIAALKVERRCCLRTGSAAALLAADGFSTSADGWPRDPR